MFYHPYPYQQKAIDSARNYFRQGYHSVLVQSPAGSGKSVIISEIVRLAIEKGGQVMFTVHRKELIEQIRDSFRFNEIDMSKVTLMSVGRIKHRLGKLPKPTLIVTDETHHSLAKTYKDIYNYYHDVPRLGFTATPWRLSGKGFKEVYDIMVEGPQIQWLIDNHYLAPAKVYAPSIADLSMLKQSSTGDYSYSSMDEMTSRIIYSDVIDTWKKLAGNRQTIVYCHSVEFSKKVAKWFNDAGITAAHADAKTKASERERIMSDFKLGKIKVLSNSDLISEGFNVPDCGCVVMLRPTKSLVLYIQQSMRCMRYKPNKEAVIIDQVGNVLEHGMPQQDRMWTLEDREKKKRKTNGSSGPAIKQCPQCFMVIPGQANICPGCQYEFKPEKQEVEIKKDVELEEVTQAFTTNYIITKRPQDLSTPAELKAYAKAKGYKQGWVWYQMKNRGWLNKKGK